MPLTIFHDDVIAGRLVPLLTEWGLQRLKINIAYPTRRHLPAKARCCDVRLVNIQARNLCVSRRPHKRTFPGDRFAASSGQSASRRSPKLTLHACCDSLRAASPERLRNVQGRRAVAMDGGNPPGTKGLQCKPLRNIV